MEHRIGKLTKVETGRWAIRYGDEKDDYDEITSGDVFEIQILGVWKTLAWRAQTANTTPRRRYP